MQMPTKAPGAPKVGRANVHLQVALSTFSGWLLESCSWLTGQERGSETGLFLSDSSSWLTAASGMLGKPGPLTGEEGHVPSSPPEHLPSLSKAHRYPVHSLA